MEQTTPRLLLAGTSSGCGKTTVTCALLQALVDRGMDVGAFKCGPDYIDPMFHSRVIGAASANLDPFFFDDNTLNYLFAKNARGRDISIVEGVMGYYDGLGLTSQCSTYDVARRTQTPAVLVVGAKGAAYSLLATIEGFLNLCPGNQICGVILNNCNPMLYPGLSDAVSRHFGPRIRPLGYLPPMPQCSLESRHLGLVTAAEVTDLKEKLRILSEQARKSLDLESLLALARSAPNLQFSPIELPREERVRIAVARDNCFCFYYEDSLAALEQMGAQLVPFSPLTDRELPRGIQGLYLGGGYPELYTRQLAQNRSMLDSVRTALEHHLPCIAECGGFMYLQSSIAGSPAVGFLEGDCRDTGRLTRFGYVTLTAKKDNMLCAAGESIRGHEFHRWDCPNTGDGFRAEKSTGGRWEAGVVSDTLYAGYPHFHFYANPGFAVKFYQTCLKEKHRHD